MAKFHVSVSLSNGKEIGFDKEAENKQEIFDSVSDLNSWYEHEVGGRTYYFKTNDVVSFTVSDRNSTKK
ncbi:hypothetical protein JOD43_002964 [Pullulanibacillus pueri]|uniref:Uncharacterized protein n=1 Tax=Pullulanibacillus pueri TaxID=1437324 RepID=A0A8J2ZX57_9BACL|nr:hypothetical protein [Pullulanibacillus pueri]MBM7682785.1 hypothetical protein [Pullulanibacillus pueri]GGH83174.1 hypothetical protein GCM10007096_23650 [Pullulanibacillus pueri]